MTDQYASEQERLIAQATARRNNSLERLQDAESTAQRLTEVREAREAEQQQRGLWADAGVGVVRAAPRAFEETFDLAGSVDEWLMRRFGALDLNPFDGGDLPWYKSFGYIRPSQIRQFEAEGGQLRSPIRVPEEGWRAVAELIPETERGSGGFTEAAGKFLIGFFTGKKALQGVNLLQGTGRGAQVANAMVAGGVSDMAVFDGHEERLSDFIESYPSMSNPITRYLEADEDDSELEGRLKNALEGGGLGVLADGLILAFRSIRASRRARAEARAVAEADEIAVPLPEPRQVAREGAEEGAARAADDTAEAGAERAADDVVEEVSDEVRISRDREAVRTAVQLTDEQQAALRAAAAGGDERAAAEILRDFNEGTYDFSKIENGEDIRRILQVTEEVMADTIDEVKGGVQSNQQTKLLANLVGSTAEEVSRLFSDVTGDRGITARFYAAQRTMLASADELRRLGREALEDPGSSQKEAAFIHQMQVHAALQAEVKGAQTEIARALQAMSIIKDSAANSFKEFDELKRQFGSRTAGNHLRDFMRDIAFESRNLADLNAKVRMTPWERFKNILVEWTINSMLSSLKTHVINFTSNALNTFIFSGDRIFGGLIRRMTAGDRAAMREAKIDVLTKVRSLDEAWNLAKQAFRDGAPVTDKRQRVEFLTRRAIAMEGDSPLATAVNYLGSIVRIPGRLLITGDEFFKAINRNAEIQVLSFRQADDEAVANGLQYGTKKYEDFVTRRSRELADPNNVSQRALEIRTQAVERSRRVTFQESPTSGLGQKAESLINHNRLIKLVIAPFFRTPMNIIRQGVFDRTPLGIIFREQRDVLLNGHPREKAEMIARMTSGLGAMVTFSLLLDEDNAGFEVIGKLPYDSSAKAANIRDYSMRIGDTWYQFNRLEPLGMWLGLVADYNTHERYNDDEEGIFAHVQAATAAFVNNVSSKTFLTSLDQLQTMIEGLRSNKRETIERSVNRFIAGEFGKLIPQLFKSTGSAIEEGLLDEPVYAREVWGVLDRFSATLPVLNQGLPNRHDALGRPIPRNNGWAAIVNPFATSEGLDDPVDQAMFDLGFTIQPMPRSLGNGAVPLSDEEYSRLTGLVSETGLHQILTSLVTSDVWPRLSEARQVALLKQQITMARQRARALFMADPEIVRRVQQQEIDEAAVLNELQQ